MPLSFQRRAEPATLPELMDDPCSYADFRACLIDLAQVNALTLAYRPTLNFLSTLPRQPQPLRILDVGSGGGDMLRRIARWASKRNIAVQLTGIDLNPHAARVAQELTPAHLNINFLTGNIYAYTPAQLPDIILSSLVTHHLSSEELVSFLAWMQTTAQRGWFINDLRRTRTSHTLFRVLATAMRWHRFVRHDGPVSIRRSFREPDWVSLLNAANIPANSVGIHRRFPYRLCVSYTR